MRDDQVEAHEDRIQKLEAGQSAVAAKLAEHSVKLEFISDAVRDGLQAVGDKIEHIVKPVADRVSSLDEALESHAKALEPLRAAEEKRLARVETYKKLGVAGAIAALGAIAKEVGTWFWNLF